MEKIPTPRKILQKKAKEQIISNINFMKNLGFTIGEISHLTGEITQVISQYMNKPTFILGLERMTRINKRFDEIISNINKNEQ